MHPAPPKRNRGCVGYHLCRLFTQLSTYFDTMCITIGAQSFI